MQTAYCFFEVPVIERKVRVSKGHRFTNRELDILEFILEMKFSTLEELHSKFFKVTKWGSTSNSLIWARQRIFQLVKSELVQILSKVCSRPLYVLTQKGFMFLRNSRPEKNFCRPLLDVDGRTLDHDKRVSQIRIAMEFSGEASNWVSERQLSEIEEVKKYLPTEFRPDGIYTDQNGRKVAFELEIARKSKDRYQQKVRRYIQVMTERKEVAPIFESVHYVCEKQTVLELIRSEVALYQPLFRFSLESEIIKQGAR